MRGTILGYEIASPEKQRETAKYLFIFVGAAIALGAFVVAYIARMEQMGRSQALATVTQVDVKCRYVVRNIGRRASFYDHTGYTDCATAERVARENDFALGRVERVAFADITFKTAKGHEVAARVELRKQLKLAAGNQVEVLYRDDNPRDVTEFKSFGPFGKRSIAPAKADAANPAKSNGADGAAVAPAAAVPSSGAPSNAAPGPTSKPSPWRGLFYLVILLALGYWLIRKVWRLTHRLVVGGGSAPDMRIAHAERRTGLQPARSPASAPRPAARQSSPRGRTSAEAGPVAADRMSRIVNRASR